MTDEERMAARTAEIGRLLAAHGLRPTVVVTAVGDDPDEAFDHLFPGPEGDRARARIAAAESRRVAAMSDEELEQLLFPPRPQGG